MNSATTTHSDHQRTNVRWKILALLFMASFVGYILRTNMSITGKSMMADLGLSNIQLGLVFSAFAWGYAIFQFPGGIFGDKVGPCRALTIIAVLWGILTLATGLIPGTTLASTTIILITLIGMPNSRHSRPLPCSRASFSGCHSQESLSGRCFPFVKLRVYPAH